MSEAHGEVGEVEDPVTPRLIHTSTRILLWQFQCNPRRASEVLYRC